MLFQSGLPTPACQDINITLCSSGMGIRQFAAKCSWKSQIFEQQHANVYITHCVVGGMHYQSDVL